MSGVVDLHTHTTASDGTLEPSELFQKAVELQLRVLAISDHDSTAGYEAVLPLVSSHPALRLIPAVELNAEGEFSCHLLGYFIDPASAELQAKLASYRALRVERVQAMTGKLRELGMQIEFERVLQIAKGGSVGRPHLADALIEKGYVKNRQEAFDRFLKKDGPAYLSSGTPSAAEVIGLVRRAGGIPVLAHPSYYFSENLLKALMEAGLMGIEIYYPDYSRSLIQRYLDLAQANGLVVTGGSDFHGPRTGRAALACVDVPEAVIKGLENARNRV